MTETFEPMDQSLKDVIDQLAQTANDPNLAIMSCHCFSLDGSESDCVNCQAYKDHVARYPNNHVKRS